MNVLIIQMNTVIILIRYIGTNTKIVLLQAYSVIKKWRIFLNSLFFRIVLF